MSSTSEIRIWFLMLCEKNTSFRSDPLSSEIGPLQALLLRHPVCAATVDVALMPDPTKSPKSLLHS